MENEEPRKSNPNEFLPCNLPQTPTSIVEFHEVFGELRTSGYEMANEHYIAELDRILTRATTYDELKNELLAFVKGRKDLDAFLSEKSNPADNGPWYIF